MAKVTVEYCGMEGTGKTLTAARQDAARKAETALTGSYTPLILECRGSAVLIYREPSGWTFRNIVDAGTVRAGNVYGGCHCGASAEQIESSAALHLAQCVWTAADGETVPGSLAKNMSREDVREFIGWTKWQLRYQAGRAKGLTDCEAHSYAGRDPGRPELWLAEDKQLAAAV